jgi:hypothetical protein
VAAHNGRVNESYGEHSVTPRLSPRSWAMAVAMTVLVCGFGALNLASAVMSVSPKLRGLYTYRAATVGDGLVLPLLCYGLVRATALQDSWPRRAKIVIACAALAGGIAGVATQIMWLLSATTPLNWTIPAPHTFNFAGGYHAGFLSLASALFAGLGAALWIRLRCEPPRLALSRLRMSGAFAITIPPLAFAGLLALDNLPVGLDPLHASTFILPIATLLILYVLMLSATHWRDVKTPAMVCAASAIPAAAVMAIFWPGSISRGHSVLIALAAAFGGVALGLPGQRPRVLDRVIAALLIAVSLAGPLIVVTDTSKVQLVPIGVALAVSMALAAIEQFLLVRLAEAAAPWTVRNSGILAVGSMLGLACAGVYLADGDEHAKSYAIWFGTAGLVLTLVVIAPWMSEQFEPVIEAEDNSAAAYILSQRKKTAYQIIAGMTGLGLVSLLSFIIGTTPAQDWKIGSWNVLLGVTIIVSAATLIIVIFTLLVATRRSSPQVLVATASLATWFVCQCVLFSLIQPVGLVGALITAYIALVIALFIAEGVHGNLSSLHNLPFDGPARIITVLSGMAAGSTVLWLLGVSYMVEGKPSNLIAAVVAVVISVAAILSLPYLASKSLRRRPPPRQFVPAAPLAGILQDSFISLLLVVFVGWLPVVVLAHLDDLTSWMAIVLPYAGYLSAAYVYIMRNNVKHVEKAFSRAKEEAGAGEIPADQQAALDGLRKHCGYQNMLALVALIPLTLVAIPLLAAQLGGFVPRAGPIYLVKQLLVP